MNLKRAIVYMLCLSLMFGAGSASALAKSSRTAVITEVAGVVEVTKAGGSRSYRAFVDMTLNQGDLLETGAGAKAVLRVADSEDEITIGEQTKLYISELMEQGGGKKSRFKVWAGTLWNKVRTLAGTEDEFEVETPTATMGVRGTNFFVRVDPEDGLPAVFAASGVVSATDLEKLVETLLYPGEETTYDSEGRSEKSFVDVDDFAETVTPQILEALLKARASLAAENEQFVAAQRELLQRERTNDVLAQLGIESPDQLQQYLQNVNRIPENVLKSATQSYIEELISRLLEDANRDTTNPIDLDGVTQPILTEKQRQKQEKLKQLKEKRLLQQEEKKRQAEQKKEQYNELFDKLLQQKLQQEEAKRQAEAEAKQNALEQYLRQLEDEQKSKLEQLLQQREEEIRRAEEQAEQYLDSSGQSADGAGLPVGGDGDEAAPAFEMAVESIELVNVVGDTAFFDLELAANLENFTGLYAVELHLLPDDGFVESPPSLSESLFDPADRESSFRVVNVDVDGQPGQEIVYAVTLVPPANALNISGSSRLVTIPMRWEVGDWTDPNISHTIEIDVIKFMAVDGNGNPIPLSNMENRISIPLDPYKNAGGV